MDWSRKLLSPRQLLDNCIYRGLKLDTSRSIKVMEIQISRSDFCARLMYLCRVSFLTTLDLYKAYFRGRHIREYKENICKRWPMPYSLWKKLLRFCALGFCNQVLLDLHHVDEVKNFEANNLLQVGRLVMYWDSCKGVSHVLGFVHKKRWCSYIEEFRGSEVVEGFCYKFIYRDCKV